MDYQYHGTINTHPRITGFVLDQLENGEVIWGNGWNELCQGKNISTGHIQRVEFFSPQLH
ncbi:MAG TPA: hypothetical protein VKR53_16890 [Puia sp.]|nr:hypothetical protein [Puia sp.]